MHTDCRMEYYLKQLKVPGVTLFGYNREKRAQAPLQFHTHAQCAELVLVLGGAECYQTAGKTYAVSRGQAFFTLPGQLHGSGGACTPVSEFYWLQLELTPCEDFLGLGSLFGGRLRDAVASCSQNLLPADEETIALIKRCHGAIRGEDDPLYLCGLFTCLLSRLFLRPGDAEEEDALIKEILLFIEQNLSEDLSLPELARKFHLSESAFAHRFRRQTGYALRDYRNRRRIEKAGELLQSGMSVTRTAMELGFNSTDYFSTVFRKYTATSPTDWVARLGGAGKEPKC